MTMIKLVSYFININIGIFIVFISHAQTSPLVSARIDTLNNESKKVYTLFSEYLNSRPDSLYNNKFWNTEEIEFYTKSNMPHFDKAAWFMYRGINAEKFLNYYSPKILQIDKIETDRYMIKTIYHADCSDKEYERFTPNYITKHYAVKNRHGKYKLENSYLYDTRNWKTYHYKFVKYIVHPDSDFSKKNAKKAIKFCKKIIKQFKLDKVKPITYYITNNSDQLGKLYNFEYWLYYSTAFTHLPIRQITTSFSNEHYPHEFIHLLFPKADSMKGRPMIITEGLATWLGGPSYDETYEEALTTFSKQIKNKSVSIESITNNEYRNDFDNNPLYLTGAVICEKVYQKHGREGIMKLYSCPNDFEKFKKVLEELFEMEYENVNNMIIEYVKNFSKD